MMFARPDDPDSDNETRDSSEEGREIGIVGGFHDNLAAVIRPPNHQVPIPSRTLQYNTVQCSQRPYRMSMA